MTARRNTFAGFAAILLWSSTVALARSISESIGPLAAGAAVFSVAGIMLAFRLALRKGSLGRLLALPKAYLFGCGLLFVVNNMSVFVALGLASDRQQVIEVALLNYMWPAFTILLSLPILGRKADARLAPGTVLALAGVFLVLTGGHDVSWSSFSGNLMRNPAACAFAAAAAVSWALYSNLTRRWGNRAGGGAVPLFVLATGLILLILRVFQGEAVAVGARTALEIAGLAAATAVACVSWDIAMRKGDIVMVTAGSYLTPLLSTVVSCLYLGVVPGVNLWLGCLLIISGSLISWRSVEKDFSTGMHLRSVP